MESASSSFSQSSAYVSLDSLNQSLGSLSIFPNELIERIFSNLTPLNLLKCCLVSKQWCIFAKDPTTWKICQTLSYPKIAFGKEQWLKYFNVCVGEEPPLPLGINEYLESECPIFADKKVMDTHMLVLIPKTINNENFTIKHLLKIVNVIYLQNEKSSKMVSQVISKYKGTPIKKSYWVLVTKEIFPESKNKSYFWQKKILENLIRKTGVRYKVPNVLEVAASIIMEYVRSEKLLYGSACTRCREIAGIGQNQLIVGGDSRYGFFAYVYSALGSDIGIGARLKPGLKTFLFLSQTKSARQVFYTLLNRTSLDSK